MKNRITKNAYAEAFKDLMKNHSLSRISVKEITDYCGLSRNSFYYHFKDKYELMNWIFHKDVDKRIDLKHSSTSCSESFAMLCKCMYEEKEFYFPCLQYSGQNSMYDILYEVYFEFWKIKLTRFYTAIGSTLRKGQIIILAQLYAHALVGEIAEWVKGGMKKEDMNLFNDISELLEKNFFIESNLKGHKGVCILYKEICK